MSDDESHSLIEWICSQPEKSFPHDNGITYPERLESVIKYMNKEVHTHVEKGAALKDGAFLNNHGVEHIKTVIERADDLLSHPRESFPQLTAYEAYLLVLAIHFHDVGNIFGRDGHESKHREVMDEMKKLVGDESVERRAILQISKAHGGDILGDKDTISHLPISDPLLGRDVRYQSLAAILRLADELADDSKRVHRIPLELGVIPEGGQIFHQYSKCLHSVKVRPKQHLVDLRFTFTKDVATQKFGKTTKDGIEKVFLLDEIFARTLKMHFERKYCMRFMQGIVRIDAVDVSVTVFDDDHSTSPCHPPISYRLKDKGYPGMSNAKISDLCPNIEITGQDLRTILESNYPKGTPQNV